MILRNDIRWLFVLFLKFRSPLDLLSAKGVQGVLFGAMDIDIIKQLLEDYKAGNVALNNVLEKIKELPYKDLGFAKVDSHRKIRCGFPEVIFCMGKTPYQVVKIVEQIVAGKNDMLATRPIGMSTRPFPKNTLMPSIMNRQKPLRSVKPSVNHRKASS